MSRSHTQKIIADACGPVIIMTLVYLQYKKKEYLDALVSHLEVAGSTWLPDIYFLPFAIPYFSLVFNICSRTYILPFYISSDQSE